MSSFLQKCWILLAILLPMSPADVASRFANSISICGRSLTIRPGLIFLICTQLLSRLNSVSLAGTKKSPVTSFRCVLNREAKRRHIRGSAESVNPLVERHRGDDPRFRVGVGVGDTSYLSSATATP